MKALSAIHRVTWRGLVLLAAIGAAAYESDDGWATPEAVNAVAGRSVWHLFVVEALRNRSLVLVNASRTRARTTIDGDRALRDMQELFSRFTMARCERRSVRRAG